MAKPRTFDHPRLSDPSDDGGEWEATADMGDWGHGHWPGEVTVYIDTKDDAQFAADAELLRPVLDRGEALGRLLVEGLWAELSGNEPQAEVWWAGNLDTVNEYLAEDDLEPVTSAEDLYRILEPESLRADFDIHGDHTPIVTVQFHCEFEQEHGLTIMTDGQQVRGTGYSGDATQYERFLSVSTEEIEAYHKAVDEALKNHQAPPPRPAWARM